MKRSASKRHSPKAIGQTVDVPKEANIAETTWKLGVIGFAVEAPFDFSH